jgi:hypothetical protein
MHLNKRLVQPSLNISLELFFEAISPRLYRRSPSGGLWQTISWSTTAPSRSEIACPRQSIRCSICSARAAIALYPLCFFIVLLKQGVVHSVAKLPPFISEGLDALLDLLQSPCDLLALVQIPL